MKWLCVLGLALGLAPAPAAKPVVVGSKNFPESRILAEILARSLEAKGHAVERRFGLQGTMVCWEALTSGGIDVYPEYSGTLEQAILKRTERLDFATLRRLLADEAGVDLLDPIGFDNTYAIAMSRKRADALGLKSIGDLAARPELKLGFSHEFLERKDGWPGLAAAYRLPQSPSGLEHGLAYRAVNEGSIDATDAYSTDGDLKRYDLVVLRDDRGYFPKYLAAPVARKGLDPGVRALLNGLAGAIDDATMTAINARAVVDGVAIETIAGDFLASRGAAGPASASPDRVGRILRRTGRHLWLSFLGLAFAILAAVPLGILVQRLGAPARPVAWAAGALQTIPSIALLAFMIPLFGIGALPAVVALFLYSLLPILRNTTTALLSIDPVLLKVANGMGLTAGQRLRHVELPLAAPTILAGIRTAAVISIGTATLAAFIGAGGLGEPIVTGLTLNDSGLILEGAIPAAILAILVELGFEGLERILIPAHLRRR